MDKCNRNTDNMAYCRFDEIGICTLIGNCKFQKEMTYLEEIKYEETMRDFNMQKAIQLDKQIENKENSLRGLYDNKRI